MASSFLEKKAKKQAEELEKKYGSSAYGGTTWLNNQLSGKSTTKKTSNDDIAPVKTSKKDEEEERTWFNSGLFEDGYDFGDITKTILGSTEDLAKNIGTGIVAIGEKAVDAFATVSPYVSQAMWNMNGGDMTRALAPEVAKQHDELIEQSKKDVAKFVSKDLYDEQKVAEFIIDHSLTGVTNKGLGVDSKAHSVFGEKSDALAQSGGQLLGQLAANAVAPGSGLALMGITSFGSEAESALMNDATLDEALLSGAISAGAEMLTEKLGGISFGGKTLTDAAFSNLSRRMTSKLAKVLITTGKVSADAMAEGGEEILSGYMSAIGQKLTYMSDKEIEELFSTEDALESFIGGAVLGGLGGAGDAVKSTIQGVDPISGLNKNEKAVVDKEYNSRLEEAEANGKLTEKEKNKLYDSVVKDMERGYISTDIIEDVLGDRSSYDALSKEAEEYDTLYNTPSGQLSKAQQDRLTELDAKNKANPYKDALNTAKDQYSQSVFELVKGDRLSESYNERSRRGQVFEADLTQYDAKQQAVIQKAIDSGILNNTNRTHEFVDLIAKISADKGVLFDFTNNEKLKDSGFAVDGKAVNGYVTKDGITLNIDSAKSLNSVVGHEITHVLEGTELYDALKQTVFEYAKSKGEYDSRVAKLTETYKSVKDADIDAELAADLVGDYLFTDADFIHRLSTENRNIFQKIYDEVKYLCKVVTAGSKEARELEKVKKAFEDAYRANGKAEGGTKYSLGYHAGDLGKAEGYWNMMSSNRGTGHFGTGTYFVGDEAKISDRYYGNRPHEKVEFDNYHLFKPLIESDGFDLHSALKYINDNIFDYPIAKMSFDEMWDVRKKADDAEYTLWDDDATDAEKAAAQKTLDDFKERFESVGYDPDHMDAQELYEELSDISKEYHLTRSKLEMIFARDLRKLSYDEQSAKIDSIMQGIYDEVSQIEDAYAAKHEDSPSTRFMKALGYEGIDVRGFKGLDNTTYGSVIYDLKGDDLARKKEIGTAKYSLSDSELDENYLDAVVNRDWETAERMVEEAAKKAGYTKVVYHGTDARFTQFDTDEESTAREQHAWMADYPDGTIFLAEDYDVADGYGERVMNLLLDTSDMKVFEEPDMYAHRAMDDKYGYEVYNYPVIAVKGKDMTIYATLDNTAVKSADTVTFGDGGEIVPLSERFKRNNPDIRFSLSEAVEETKDLLAVHNLTSEQVLKSLELGGLPMPSVAVLKANSVHDEYGDVSLILSKNAIDPKANRANKVYGGDAWTPVYPRIEYKPSAAIEKKISNKYYGLAREIGYDAVRPMYNYVTDLERQLNNSGGESAMLEKLYEDTDMMNLYLQDSGKGKIEPIEKETVTEISPEQAEMNQFFIDALGDEVIAKYPTPKGESMGLHRRQFVEQYGDEIRTAYKRFFMELYEFSETEADNAVNNTSKADLLHIVRDAYQYTQNKGVTVKTEIDRQATNEAIRKAAADGYKEWVDGLFKGVEEKTGIRNNQDYYTRSGNPRSWDALHWENTLENVVKTMKGQEETGTTSFSPYNSFASLSHKRYGSIAEIKADSNRLGKISQEEYEAMGDSFAQRFVEIANSIKDPAERNPFIAADNAAELIVDAVRTQKTRAGMLNYLQKWNERVTEQTVEDVISLASDIANMPTGYFEAKPQRAVTFDEVGVFVIPNNADIKLKQELLNRGYSIAEYDPNIEGHRQQVVNQFEEYKFSLSEAGEQPRRYGTYNIYGKDIGVNDPLAEFAPVAENATTAEESPVVPTVAENATVSETESVAPVVISKNETTTPVTPEEMRELFPDDLAPNELDSLLQEKEALEGRMLEMANSEDFTEFDAVTDRYAVVMSGIEALKKDEADRIGSLDDADIPPEREAVRGYGAVTAEDPFADRSETAVGNRSVKAYQYENPEVKPFFREAAYALAEDINLSIPAERWYNDDLYYASGGEQGFGGNSRLTAKDVGDFKDQWKCSWDDLREAVNDIIEDHGKENNALSKRVEFLINDRLMYGYTNIRGERIEPNQAYLDFLKEKQINEYSQEAREAFFANAEQYAPFDIAPVPQTDVQAVNPYDSIGAAPYGFDPITQLQYEYGNLPDGEHPVREDSMPKSTNGKDKVSLTARTVKGAGATPDEFVDLLHKETVGGRFSYIPITNSDTVQKAYNEIVKKGWEAARGEWEAKVRRGEVSAELTATGSLLLNHAAKAGDRNAWLSVLHDYQIMGTNAGQAVQAMRILKTLTPDDSLYMIERSVEQMVEDMKLGTEIVIDDNLKQNYLNAKTDGERDAARQAIAKDVARQIPSTAMDKWTALRYLNMLGNFRTQVRNIIGNFGMSATSSTRNAVATVIEWIANKASGGKFHRTKSIFVNKAQLKAARNDFENVKTVALNGGKFNDPNAKSLQFQQEVQDARKIFKIAPLEWYRRGTNRAMDTGDLVFSKTAYGRALAGYLKANGIKEADFSKIDQQTLDKARAYAINEAQETTFRDNNWLSSWVSKLGRGKNTPKGVKIVSEGVMPFRKTPANILLRAEEYSPLGFVNATVKSIQAAKGNATGADVVNSWAKALTGTGLFALGMWLNNSGMLSGGPDEDDDKEWFEDQYGWQNYAIQIGDKNYTIDFLSPAAMPLLMGAQLNELRQKSGIELKDLEKALLSIADPMIEMSMLQGVNDTLDNIRYAESNMGQFIVNACVSYLTQGLTNSFLGQLERSLEGQRMSTYTDKDSELPAWLQKALGKASAKTPGWDYNQIPYVDAWGETEDIAPLPGLAENTLSPSYISQGITDAVYEELNRLNDAQSDINVYPQTPDKTVTFDDAYGNRHEDYNLSAEEYVELAKLQGQTQKELVEDILSSYLYSGLSDKEKARAVQLAYQYAKEYSRQEVLGADGFSADWMKRADDKGDIVNAIIHHTNDEMTFAYENPEKYSFFTENGISWDDYDSADAEKKQEYSNMYTWVSDEEHPGRYSMAKAVADDFQTFWQYKSDCNNFDAKDENGETVNGLKKERVIDYINSLDIDYGARLILFRSMYDGKKDKETYDQDIIDYLNSREDISYEDMEAILNELG